jgi:TonB family protein
VRGDFEKGKIVLKVLMALVALMTAGLSSAEAPARPKSFEPAEVVSAAEVVYPPQSVAVGTVVLEVTVGEKGEVEDVRPIREIASLTEVAVESVKKWQFKPAMRRGKPIQSRTVVAVTFIPALSFYKNVPLPPLSATEPSAGPPLEPEPVKVVEASFPKYPMNTLASGTVVVRVRVDKQGQAEDMRAVREIPALTEPCLRALKEWKFEAAQYRGKPIAGSIAIAFVMRPPPPYG